MWFHRNDEAPLAFAGIWSAEQSEDGGITSCDTITCAANDLVAPIHQRMPVMLPRDRYWEWIAPQADVEDLNCLT